MADGHKSTVSGDQLVERVGEPVVHLYLDGSGRAGVTWKSLSGCSTAGQTALSHMGRGELG